MIKLLVGLGNPGPQYDKTRHNAGAWLIEQLANDAGIQLQADKKFHGLTAKIQINSHATHLLLPTTFMNHSGQAVQAISAFYKIEPQHILIAHDELDLPAGQVKLKSSGGHGGHNGLRDIIRHLGQTDFHRLRIGIDHPGDKNRVLDYVLGRPSVADEKNIHHAIDETIALMPQIIKGEFALVMNRLHSKGD